MSKIEEIRRRVEVARGRYASGDVIGSLARAFVHEDMPHLLAKVEAAEGVAGALEDIAYMRMDCPVGMDPESFYRRQLSAAIGTAARALARYRQAGSDQ